MARRIPLLFRQAAYSLRGGFLVRPLTIALSLGTAGAVFSSLEETFPADAARWLSVLFPSQTDPQVAQIILSSIATSIMTVVSIVFAILLMTLTLASMQFSPRILVSFVRDRVTQWTLGVFLGTFSYCMAALPAARSAPRPFAPVFTVLGAMILALACVAWLLFFIHHISHAISVNHIVDRIASETLAVVDSLMPHPRRGERLPHPDQREPETWEARVTSEVSGYIRFIDIKRLVEVAMEHHVKVGVMRRVGQFAPAGVPLLRASKWDALTPEAIAAFRSAFDYGPARTLQQDVEFGVLQIVDIALKAISPAVNDPSTAIGCVDQLSRIMIAVISRDLPESLLYDPPGVLRVNIPWIGFEGLLDSAFEQIRMYSKSDVAVSLRLLRALGDIASTTQDPQLHQIFAERGQRVVDGCASRLSEDEVRPLRERYNKTWLKA